MGKLGVGVKVRTTVLQRCFWRVGGGQMWGGQYWH